MARRKKFVTFPYGGKPGKVHLMYFDKDRHLWRLDCTSRVYRGEIIPYETPIEVTCLQCNPLARRES